ncbi:RNA polymerase sigma factor [Patulibacter defluvii]|uniref:RNA polymerase sigma factor n=1 Tax=Patulibacter defluvii TaxID=3095358 RepID=UPI002A74D5D6|nr:sigma-70 family RNA polymerase sigma factor [Patulibacter sp. DM4]
MPAPALPFDTIVERHGPALLRFCVARLGRDHGEDAFQETLLAALRHYDELRDPEAVAGWLFAIAHRKLVDAVRARDRAPQPSDRIEEQPAPAAPAPGVDPIWRRVATLPPKQRQAVALRFLADLPHAQIAVAMGTSPEAARRNLHEGLRRLRADPALAPHDPSLPTVSRP